MKMMRNQVNKTTKRWGFMKFGQIGFRLRLKSQNRPKNSEPSQCIHKTLIDTSQLGSAIGLFRFVVTLCCNSV